MVCHCSDPLPDSSIHVSEADVHPLRLSRALVLMLGAPTLWMAYFFAVYLASEQACQEVKGAEAHADELRVAVLTLSVLAMAGMIGLARWARRSNATEGPVEPNLFSRRVARSLSWFLGCSIPFVGLPIIWLMPC